MRIGRLYLAFALSSVALFITPLRAQATNASVQGIPAPPSVVMLGEQDSAALQEIRSYRNAIKAGNWSGMHADGVFTPNAPDSTGAQSQPVPAMLFILGTRRFRLDVKKSKGTRSLRISGTWGATRHSGGALSNIDARNAAAGLFAFPTLMQVGFPKAATTLIDQGMIAIDGATLHRITLGVPWPGGYSSDGKQSRISVTDLYFDPSSHLLIKSATSDVGGGSEPAQYLRVINYGNYQDAGGITLPYLYSEVFNGQLLWTLKLDTISLTNQPTDSDFHF